MQKERRAEERIALESLPDYLKNISFSIKGLLFDEHSASTVDASVSGMSFLAKGVGEKDIMTGQEVIINVVLNDYELKLRSKVIYTNEVNKNSLRFGINFHKNDSLEKYQKILKLSN